MPPYPAYQPTEAGSSTYEEYDLDRAARRFEVGPSSPMPRPRSSYSSPPPPARSSGSRYRHSLDPYAHGYGRPPAPSSAPGRYTNAGYREPMYSPHEHIPGQFPATYDAPADYWYAGPPQSDGHSSYGGWQEREYRGGPPSAYSSDPPHELFDVNAPHHYPDYRPYDERSRDPRQNTPLPYFTNWSRTWYDGHLSANGHAYTMARPPTGADGWEADTFTRSGRDGQSMPSTADRVKAERMRMLEKEFGKPKISHRGEDDDDDDEREGYERDTDELLDPDAEVGIGGVTSHGRIVTERPKIDLTLRCVIALTAIAIVGCGIGGDLLIKAGDQPPPAKGSMPSYILYLVSVFTLAIIAYSYLLRLCCCNPMRKELNAGGIAPGGPMAGMVIPVLSGQQGGQKPKGIFGRGKKNRFGMMQQAPPPTVNLIVNPEMFGDKQRKKKKKRKGAESDEDSEDSDEPYLPGDYRRAGGRRKRLSPGEHMQMQRRWQIARKSLKIRTALDALLFVAYIGCSVVTLGLGKSKPCPASAGNGWCTYYHAAIACCIVQAVWLIGALFLDYRDLSVSREIPRA